MIDTIDWNTFEYYMQTEEPMIGGFDWRLTFQWHVIPEAERRRRKSKTDPIRWAQRRRGFGLAPQQDGHRAESAKPSGVRLQHDFLRKCRYH